jgi:hypothetical protein
MLQQISVVAGDFDHKRIGPEPEALGGLIDERFRVLDPAVGIRRVVGVFGESLLRRDQRGNLQQQAVLTQPQVQRISELGQIEFGC